MPSDEQLAQRIRELIPPGKSYAETRMFGGLVFLLDGHIGSSADGLS